MSKMDLSAIHSDIAANSLGWVAEENPITRLSETEQLLRLGYAPDPSSGELSLILREQHASATASASRVNSAGAEGAPASVDLRAFNGHNYITDVRDQSSCGSCVAFGTIAAIEGTARFVNRNASLAIDLSEGHLFNCIARSQGRNCGIGWWVDPAVTAAANIGIVDEACSPYSPADTQCTLCANWQSRVTKIRSSQTLTNPAAMKDWISTKGPVVSCFSVYSDFFAYRSGVYRRSPSSTFSGGHCICVVGYDDAQGAWICKNSWGRGWGDAGFFRIAYGECGIDATMWGVEVFGSAPPPQGLAPLHRYWNSSIGDHFYTTNWGELGGGRYGWGYEGVQCDIATAPQAGLVPLYRYWNSSAGDHFYTTNWSELGTGRYGWAFEAIQGYVSPTPKPGLTPLYRYWNSSIADHFYTTNWGELGSGRYGWGYEGIQCYVWPSSATVAGGDAPETFRVVGANSVGAVSLAPAGYDAVSESSTVTPASFTVASDTSPPGSFVLTNDSTNSTPASFTTAAESSDCGCKKKR